MATINQKRDFGGHTGVLMSETNVTRTVKLGKDFIPPLGFEFAVDSTEFQLQNKEFQKEFKELAGLPGLHILVDEVSDIKILPVDVFVGEQSEPVSTANNIEVTTIRRVYDLGDLAKFTEEVEGLQRDDQNAL